MPEKKKTLPVRTVGDGVLAQKAKPVEKITPEIVELAETMVYTMYKNNGIGLAAPQVGIGLRMFVIHVYRPEDEDGNPLPANSPGELELLPQMPLAFVNPKIVAYGPEMEDREEGCLSLPGLYANVKRPSTITFQGTLLDGRSIQVECGGMLARCIQHEYDHLDGIVFAQKADPESFDKIKKGIDKFAKKNGKRNFKLRRLV